MIADSVDKRLAALEARQKQAAPDYSAAELGELAAAYAQQLDQSAPSDPRHEAYIASHTLEEIAADYAAMLRGAPASWLDGRSQP